MTEKTVVRVKGLPSLFRSDIFDQFFGAMGEEKERFFEFPATVYPYNVVEYKDVNGKPEKAELTFALAGIPKENVKIDVDGDVVNISVEKVEDTTAENAQCLHRGISRRSMQVGYRAAEPIQKEAIKATFDQGLLRIELPFVKKEAFTISIN